MATLRLRCILRASLPCPENHCRLSSFWIDMADDDASFLAKQEINPSTIGWSCSRAHTIAAARLCMCLSSQGVCRDLPFPFCGNRWQKKRQTWIVRAGNVFIPLSQWGSLAPSCLKVFKDSEVNRGNTHLPCHKISGLDLIHKLHKQRRQISLWVVLPNTNLD
jgi:hypothetical protein